MRDLTTSEKNEILIFDKLGGTNIIFYHRTVIASDRLSYKSLTIEKLNAGVKMEEIAEQQLDFILEFITGVSEGAFSINNKPISSDPKSKKYYEGWKSVIREKASDLLETVKTVLFDETNFLIKKNSTLPMNSGNGKTRGPKKRKKNTLKNIKAM